MLYVGIDWASDHHDICLTDDSAQTLAAFRIANGSEGFERLHDVIKEHQPEPQQVLVALETTRGLLVHDLLRSGYQVYEHQSESRQPLQRSPRGVESQNGFGRCFLPGPSAADRPSPPSVCAAHRKFSTSMMLCSGGNTT